MKQRIPVISQIVFWAIATILFSFGFAKNHSSEPDYLISFEKCLNSPCLTTTNKILIAQQDAKLITGSDVKAPHKIAIRKVCQDNGKRVRLIVKQVGNQKMLFCQHNKKALNINLMAFCIRVNC